MSHVFVLPEAGRPHTPTLRPAVHRRALLVAAAIAAGAAVFGSYNLEHRALPVPQSSCGHVVGAFGPYGIADGGGQTASGPGCTAAP
ncbi:MAG TPA: hypothetical protein VNF07_03655 [Acidimicrobiales bacterium]|nr:hypothetical protein [Acidimicrobiales bacterium]